MLVVLEKQRKKVILRSLEITTRTEAKEWSH